MKPPAIGLLLGQEPDEEEAPPSSEKMGEEEFDDLTPKEIAEHKHTSAEAMLKAISEGDSKALLKAFESLHGLDHADWESEGAEQAPEEKEEAPEEEPE